MRDPSGSRADSGDHLLDKLLDDQSLFQKVWFLQGGVSVGISRPSPSTSLHAAPPMWSCAAGPCCSDRRGLDREGFSHSEAFRSGHRHFGGPGCPVAFVAAGLVDMGAAAFVRRRTSSERSQPTRSLGWAEYTAWRELGRFTATFQVLGKAASDGGAGAATVKVCWVRRRRGFSDGRRIRV